MKYFLDQRANTLFQQKQVSKSLGFDYEIQYGKGSENLVVDALSRLQEPISQDARHSTTIYDSMCLMAVT